VIAPAEASSGPKPVSRFRGRPVDDPLPDGTPIIDEPDREVPAVDPRRRDAPEPVREPDHDSSREPFRP
jgi:hypothetical protein